MSKEKCPLCQCDKHITWCPTYGCGCFDPAHVFPTDVREAVRSGVGAKPLGDAYLDAVRTSMQVTAQWREQDAADAQFYRPESRPVPGAVMSVVSEICRRIVQKEAAAKDVMNSHETTPEEAVRNFQRTVEALRCAEESLDLVAEVLGIH
jgi:hypothetical protein